MHGTTSVDEIRLMMKYKSSDAVKGVTMENKHTMSDLYQMQSMSLNDKIRMTKYRIKEWVNTYGEDEVYLSFSGGKDSTVLGHIIREVCGYKNIPFVFVDVPTQYPELKEFAKTFDNLVILKPKISFAEVCEKYGFPLFGKEIANCIDGARRYVKCLDSKKQQQHNLNRQTDRQADSSVRLLYGRLVRNRQESKQRQCGL